MKRFNSYFLIILSAAFISFIYIKSESGINGRTEAYASANQRTVVRLDATEATINFETADIVEDERLSNNKGVTIKSDVPAAIDGERALPDLVFDVNVPAGRYVMHTYAVTDEEGADLMRKATSKFESLFLRLQIDERRSTKRVVYVPWDRPRQETGKFEFSGSGQKLKIWLPRGVRLEYVQLSGYTPPQVPEKVQNYRPEIAPPPSRPRLWVNAQSLPEIMERLEAEENLEVWNRVRKSALDPYIFDYDPKVEMSFDADLERAAESKAFYYLMTGERKVGREAVELMAAYLSVVEFGNLLDITRERGRAIYFGSLVFDWCYNLMTRAEKEEMVSNLLRLADDMEIGWPPFRTSVVTGHGNEAQVSRDLLSMSIAIYDEDPVPYHYCSHRILEELVPMRNWQYQSPRHNQGINYGAYRSVWDMHAAWLFYRMTGEPVFDENLKYLPQYWLYMRLPDGQMLRDGDGFNAGSAGEFYYWRHPFSTFLFYTYAADPVLKAEFIRQGGLRQEPVLFLLLNDPFMEPDDAIECLPLTKDFGPVLGSMIARTGWQIDMHSNDVVAEIKGGGYHFGNHQQSDAGSIQIYYRGFQVADLGLYGFYGTPYDFNFNKRSIAHSMMLVRDPEEIFGNTESNDGGTRFNQRHPDTPEIAQTDSWFNNGKVISADFGSDENRPSFSYFSVDLTGAYSSKLEAYTRGFCFLNLEQEAIPAAIILADNVVTADSGFTKYWQINTHNLPVTTETGVILNNERNGLVGRTHVNMLVPAGKNRDIEILSGEDANSSFGFKYEIPGRIAHLVYPEGNGHRIMISPKTARFHDRFLTVFQMTADNTESLPLSFSETAVSYVVTIADRVVSMSKGELIDTDFEIRIEEGSDLQVVLTGMAHGNWRIRSRDGKTNFNTTVRDGKNTIHFVAGKGDYSIAPNPANLQPVRL